MTAPEQPEFIEVAGLRIPSALALRIIDAARGSYPELTAGRDDDAAIQAVLKYWVVSMLATHEANLAEAPVEDEVAEVKKNYRAKAEQARHNVLQAATSIVNAKGEEPLASDQPGQQTPPGKA